MIDSANDARYEREIESSLSLSQPSQRRFSLFHSLISRWTADSPSFIKRLSERERETERDGERKGGREEGRVATSFRSCAAEARLPATGQTDERDREREGHEVLVNRLKGRIESCPSLDGKESELVC